MSLRSRLLAVLAGLAITGLAVANVATYLSLRSYLADQLDRSLAAESQVLALRLTSPGRLRMPDLLQLAVSTPGAWVGTITAGGGAAVWLTPSPTTTAPAPRAQLPSDVSVTQASPVATFTQPARSGGDGYRVQAQLLDASTGTVLLLAVPLRGVNATLHRLVVVEVLVSAAVVAAMIGLGLWLVGVGLRPLRRIEATAAAIAEGDLTRRVDAPMTRTEVGRLGLALNTMLEQIEQAFAQRVASEERLRRFIADASHELRTPLSAVRAYTELFEHGARSRPDDLERAMNGILRESQRMGVLIDDLLLLARLDQGRPLDRSAVDLGVISREAVDAARAVDHHHPIELVSEAPAGVIGDPHRLRQVLDNLLANVRAHTPAGTASSVRVYRRDRSVMIDVADNGPGIDPAGSEQVFERFWRGDASRSRRTAGSGLGLAIVRAIIEAHGGSVSVTSTGSGATFHVVLPADPASDEPAGLDAAARKRPSSATPA